MIVKLGKKILKIRVRPINEECFVDHHLGCNGVFDIEVTAGSIYIYKIGYRKAYNLCHIVEYDVYYEEKT